MPITEVAPQHSLSPDRQIGKNKELLSKGFSIRYTPRVLFGGDIDTFRRPFTRDTIRSGESNELQFKEGAFSIPQDPAPLRKLCNAFGVKPPVSAEDIPEFVRSQIEDVKDSEGNNHFENKLLYLLFAPPEKENQAISFIQSLDAPEKPDGCSEIVGTLDGQEMDFHLHASYQGNNKRVLTMFSLLGHKPSQALLTKWVEKQPEFQGTSSEIVTTKMTDVIIARKEKEIKASKEQEQKKELTPQEQADAIASVVFAEALNQENNPEIAEQFDKLSSAGFVGKIDIDTEQPLELRQINEDYSQAFTTTLKTFREEVNVDPQRMALSLARMHDSSIKAEDLQKPLANTPSTNKKTANKEAVIALSIALEIATRPTDTQLSLQEQKAKNYAEKLKKDKGIVYFQIGIEGKHDTADTALHFVQTAKGLQLCPDHAQEANKTLQQASEAVIKPVQSIVAKSNRLNNPTSRAIPLERPRGGIPVQNQTSHNHETSHAHDHEGHDHHEEQLPMTMPVRKMLLALGSTRVSEESTKTPENTEAIWRERFHAVAETAHAAATFDDATIKEQLTILIEDKYVGKINKEKQNKLSGEQKEALSEISNEQTEIFKQSLTALREKRPVDSIKLAVILAQLHNGEGESLDPVVQSPKIPKIDQLTDKQIGDILAIDMAIQTQPKNAPAFPRQETIQERARELNDKGFYYIQNSPDHDSAFHFENLSIDNLRKGMHAATCPEHTQQKDAQLKQIRETVAKTVAVKIAQKPQPVTPLLQRPELRPMGGSTYWLDEEKRRRELANKKTSTPPKPEAKKEEPKQQPIQVQMKPRPSSGRPPSRPETPRINRKEQLVLPLKRKFPQTRVFVDRETPGYDSLPSVLTREIVSNRLSADIVARQGASQKPNVSLVEGGSQNLSRSDVRATMNITRDGSPIAVAPERSTVRLSETGEARMASNARFSEGAERTVAAPAQAKAAISDGAKLTEVRKALREISIPQPVATDSFASSISVPSFSTEASTRQGGSKAKKSPLARLVEKSAKQRSIRGGTSDSTSSDKITLSVSEPKTSKAEISPAKATVAAKPKTGIFRDESSEGVSSSSVKDYSTASDKSSAERIVTVAPPKDEQPKIFVATSPTATATVESIPSNAVRTNANEATSVVTVQPSNPSPRPVSSSSSLSAVPVGETKRNTKSVNTADAPRPSDKPKPTDTLNPHSQVAKEAEKTRQVTGEATTQQVQKAFEQREEQRVEQQVTQQLQQATENIEVEQAQVAKGTTIEKNEQPAQTELQKGTGDTKAKEEDISVHQTNVSQETERVTKVKVEVAPGVYEERYVTEKIEQTQTTGKIQKDAEQTDHIPSQTVQTEATNQDRGTVESGQQSTTQQKQTLAPVIPLSRKKIRQGKSQGASMTAELAAADGHYLPMDPFGAKSELQQVLSQLAA